MNCSCSYAACDFYLLRKYVFLDISLFNNFSIFPNFAQEWPLLASITQPFLLLNSPQFWVSGALLTYSFFCAPSLLKTETMPVLSPLLKGSWAWCLGSLFFLNIIFVKWLVRKSIEKREIDVLLKDNIRFGCVGKRGRYDYEGNKEKLRFVKVRCTCRMTGENTEHF